LFQLPIPRLERLGLLRNIIKKRGIYEIVRLRSSDDQIILFDEGVLHVAHNLFVHGSVEVDHAYLSTFADLVPLPDVVVYLKQPEKLLIDRTMKRGHKRIPDRSYRCIAPFIKQAVATFDRLVQYPPVQKKLLIIGDEQLAPAVTHDSGKPVIDLALKIIQRDFMSAVDCQPAEISYVE
jgi:hypothetical protein